MHTIQIRHHPSSWVCVSNAGSALRIEYPESFEASIEGIARAKGKGHDRETAVGDCLQAASVDSLTELVLPKDWRRISAAELGRMVIEGRISNMTVTEGA
jgi:hypothetical protein